MTLDQKTHQRLFRSVAPVPEPYQAETVAAWRFRLLGGLVCLLSLAAGLYELGRPSVWFDEAASWAITNGNWKEYWILTTGGDDCGGFIYTLLLRFWTACAGKSEIALRLPSVLAATAFTGVMLMVGRSLWGRAAGLAVGLLAALHPQVIAWSRQARAYSPELLATALCVAAVLAYSRSGRRRDGWLLAGAVFLVVALHTFGTFVAAGVLLFLVSRRLGPGQAEEDGAPAALHLWPTFPALLFAVIWHMLMIPRIRANLVHFWTEGTILENYALVLRTHLPLWPAYGGLLAAGGAGLGHPRGSPCSSTLGGSNATGRSSSSWPASRFRSSAAPCWRRCRASITSSRRATSCRPSCCSSYRWATCCHGSRPSSPRRPCWAWLPSCSPRTRCPEPMERSRSTAATHGAPPVT